MPEMCVLLWEALVAVLEQVLCGGGKAPSPSSSTLFHHPQRDLCSSWIELLQWLQMCLRSLFSPARPLFVGGFCHHRCCMWESVAAIKLRDGSTQDRNQEGENVSPLPHPLCCLQIKISNLNLKCAFKDINPLVPCCLCWCLPGCVWAPSAVHLALTPLRLNDKFSLCLLLFVLFCFFSFQPSWHLILPQPVKYNPETCGWENVALCHAHFRGAN